MIRFHELVFGYENVARLQMEKGNYVNAKEQLRKALRTIKKEKFTENEKKEVLVTLDKIFEDYIQLEEPSSTLDTIEAIKMMSNGKIDLRKYGEIFLRKFSKAADFYLYESRLKELIPDDLDNSSSYSNTNEGTGIKAPGELKINGSGSETQSQTQVQVDGDAKVSGAGESGSGEDLLSIKIALARAEINKNNREMALKILNEILKEKPDYKEAKIMIDSILRTEEREKMLQEINRKINNIGPKSKEENEILIAAFMKDFERANELVTKQISLNRENARLWLIKAFIVKNMGNDKLFSNFESFAKKLDPGIEKTAIYKELFGK